MAMAHWPEALTHAPSRDLDLVLVELTPKRKDRHTEPPKTSRTRETDAHGPEHAVNETDKMCKHETASTWETAQQAKRQAARVKRPNVA